MKAQIFVITHKEIKNKWPSENPEYKPLQVGGGADISGYLRDNVGDNISELNPYFCELTGLYWIWKNCDDLDVVGICHYRRFFVNKIGMILHSVFGFNKGFITAGKITGTLDKYDVIVPRLYRQKPNVISYYGRFHNRSDLDMVREAIQELCPHYLDSFDRVMYSDRNYFFNMLITTKSNFDHYCNWLFDLLFLVKEKIDYQSYDSYQKRVFGFLSERLLKVWIDANNLKVHSEPVIFIKDRVRTK